jgi:hypothetical protein
MDLHRPTDPTAHRAPVLVVGVGSELRSDDAAGRHVATEVAAELTAGTAAPAPARRHRDDVEVRSVHQLTPDPSLRARVRLCRSAGGRETRLSLRPQHVVAVETVEVPVSW